MTKKLSEESCCYIFLAEQLRIELRSKALEALILTVVLLLYIYPNVMRL